MKISYPHYYKAFSCIAALCPDSCCKEWEVDVDPEAASAYRALPGPLGDRLREVLRDEEDGWASMAITDRRCPMWRQDGLCQIQAELGHAALCKTCREFPRLTHDYGDFQERGLELSCPEAARLILSSRNTELLCEEVSGSTDADYDGELMEILLTSRKQALELLADSKYRLGDALSILLLFGYDVHSALDFPEDAPLSLNEEEYLSTARKLTQAGDPTELLDVYRELEILTEDWQTMLDNGPVPRDWLPEHRSLAVYLVHRYWLQAISDGDLLCRVKFILTACLTVRHLDAPVLRAAQLWSKEIENDADNVEALLTAAYHSPALTDAKLLHLLRQ